MGLTVAIQMDPIERIDIGGDSTFALALEAQNRGHGLLYYGPRDLTFRDGKVIQKPAPPVVSAQNGRHDRAVRQHHDEAQILVSREEIRDCRRRIGVGEADARRRAPERQHLRVIDERHGTHARSRGAKAAGHGGDATLRPPCRAKRRESSSKPA